MSKVTIQGDASGTGIFTIASPNSNTDRTLVLPDEAGTVVVADALGAIDVASYKKGGVAGKLLVQSGLGYDGTNYSTSGFTNTFLSDVITFTPVSADSEVWVSIQSYLDLEQTGGDNDVFGNLYAYTVESNSTTLVSYVGMSTGTTDNNFGFVNMTTNGTVYHCVNIEGQATRSSDGSVRMRLYGALANDVTSGYAATMTMRTTLFTFKEYL